MYIIIPGAFNATTEISGAQGQVVTVGSFLKVTERTRRPYPSDQGVPSEIWVDTSAGIGYVCKEALAGKYVWDRLDTLGDFVTFGDADPGVNQDIKLGYRPGSLRYARGSDTLWICSDNTQGAAVWNVLSSGSSVISVNGQTGVVQLYLDDLLDVDVPTPTDGYVLTWDAGTSTWIAAPPSGSGSTYTVDNGLIENPTNNFQLGGQTLGTGNLIRDTYITNDGYLFRIDQNDGTNLYLNNTTAINGIGLLSLIDNGRAVRARSLDGICIEGVSVTDYSGQFIRNGVTNNDIIGILQIVRNGSGTAASGIGASIDFGLETIGGSNLLSNKIESFWSNALDASRLSVFRIKGIHSGVEKSLFTLTGNGWAGLSQYGSGTFSDTLAYALGVNSDGDIIEFTPGGGSILTTDSITGDGTTGNEVKLVNDQATPAYPGVYGIDASGNKNWRSDTSVRGDIPLAWMQESYITSTNQTGVLYVPSVSKLYVCNNTSNTITIYDTTNGTLLATLANTGAFQAFYIASIDEVWVTSSSLTTINRISTSSNASITTISGATANGVDCVEYSSTKVYISVQNATGRIMLLNPFTINVTNAVSSSVTLNVPSNPIGMCLNTNASSAQYNHIILSCGGGVAIYDPTIDAITTTLTNPSSAISSGRTIKYITSTDQYAIANPGNLNIVILDIASATTFTVNSTIRNMSGIQDLCVDETNGYIFTTVSGLTSAAILFVTVIDLTTKLVKLTIPTNVICGASTAAGKISLDQSNTRMFVCGKSSVTNVVSTIKYV